MTLQLAGHLLVDCLLAQGTTHAFGVPGESYLAVLDGLHARRDQISFPHIALLGAVYHRKIFAWIGLY